MDPKNSNLDDDITNPASMKGDKFDITKGGKGSNALTILNNFCLAKSLYATEDKLYRERLKKTSLGLRKKDKINESIAEKIASLLFSEEQNYPTRNHLDRIIGMGLIAIHQFADCNLHSLAFF